MSPVVRGGWPPTLTLEFGLEEISKLCQADAGVPICVHAADDGEDFVLRQIVAMTLEELSQVGNVDGTLIVAIDCLEGRLYAVVGPHFDLFLQSRNSSDKINLVLK